MLSDFRQDRTYRVLESNQLIAEQPCVVATKLLIEIISNNLSNLINHFIPDI